MKNTANYNLRKPESADYYNVEDHNANMDAIDEALNEKVQKIDGKGLSTEDFTSAEKTKLADLGTWAAGEFSPINHNHDNEYLKKNDKAVDSDKLDGKNSTEFASNVHNHDSTYEKIISKKSGFNLEKSDSVSSTSSTILATLRAVKTAYDKAVSALNIANTKEPAFSKNSGFNLNISNSVSSSSSSTIASSSAVQTAYNKGVEALNKANSKLDTTYGNTATTSTSFTLNSGYKDRVILAGSSNNRVITIPNGVFANGDQITAVRTSTGAVTFSPASGVTLRSVDNKRSIKDQYGSVSIVFSSSSVAYLFGSLE